MILNVPVGAMVAFLVTVSDYAMLDIGTPFWGLVFGYAATRMFEGGISVGSAVTNP